jgi:IS605 OrfB family transposase
VKKLGLPKRKGYGLVAGFDLNSDRINMVVVDGSGRIVSLKSKRFPEVTLHGFPKNRARDIRLKSLKELLRYARNIGVDYVVFENLFIIKKRGKTYSPSGNRKITRFAKKQLLQHGLVMAVKLGLTPVLVDPSGTTHSREHEEVMGEKGLDRHMASAYLIAIRGLEIIKIHEK